MGGKPRSVEVLESVDVCEANVWPSRFEVLWAAFLDLLVVGEEGWGSRSARGRFITFQLLQPILFQPEQFSTIELLVRCFNWASMSSVPDAQTVGLDVSASAGEAERPMAISLPLAPWHVIGLNCCFVFRFRTVRFSVVLPHSP